MWALELLLLTLALAGHAAFWIGAMNRLHAFNLHRHLVDALTLAICLLLVVLPWLWLPIANRLVGWPILWDAPAGWSVAGRAYEWFCAAVAIAAGGHLIWRRRHRERVVPVAAHCTREIVLPADPPATLFAAGLPRMLGTLPGNQTLAPRVRELTLAFADLPNELAGLRIVQLSDLHMSGRIDIGYYQSIVDACNELRPDLVALTGDIVERTKCLDWLELCIDRLQATASRCFVLGNHDLKVDCNELRQRLVARNWHDVAQCPIESTHGAATLQIVGNDQPWFAGPPHSFGNVRRADAFRLLLAHTPDLFVWARQRQFDLMLAGHNHGGQIKFPLVGAIVAPSRYGTRYADGLFHADGTVMHVSPGSGSLAPLRWNCRPEVTLLVLSRGV
jgi:predicted MPP superfamily phosphohydrolase